MDFLLAVVAVVPAFPFFILVSLLLFIVNRGKVFFRQQRVGFQERIFTAWKFRTMNDARDQAGNLLPDENRLTPVGSFIRKTSIDEIPQIVNVLKGDMSFIGPRPLLPEYLPYYDEIQKQRHSVKPGITGLAQVNGRNLTTWEKRLEMDVYYVRNVSFRLDLKIFFHTIVKVLRSEGISAEGHATMPKFSDYIKAKATK
jgi:undecaprenyl phosphate N,N'-diacetylbacillosamine 1-phosphate transferase